ncbi:hypothetical protein C7Y72_09830 [Paraconexibacter algicola]|uniref:Class I SAM-dependent methyltransferase n=1 Tax=Paraconexibacter algicola TaxID=2133960 RepID=A0A2T4UL08_9ACTN|nr:hypothetical protein C7Y72_09830 [Paraconexibacter algicola]
MSGDTRRIVWRTGARWRRGPACGDRRRARAHYRPRPVTTEATADPTACAWCGVGFPIGARRVPGGLRCEACGVVTTAPWPTDDELDAAYAGFYRPESGRFSGPLDRLLALSRGRLATHLDAVAPVGPVLDVGAGDGTLVRAIRRTGRDAIGLERARPDMRDAAPSDLEAEDTRYAAVVFWHVLEHLRDPADQLAAAARLLRPGGILVVAVPNAASLQARLFGHDWLALDLPRHLTHLHPRALETRAHELSLTVLRRSQLRGGQVLFGWIHGLTRRLTGLDLYDAIRRAEAQQTPHTGPRRALTLLAGTALAPLALLGVAVEVATRRSGTIYLELQR